MIGGNTRVNLDAPPYFLYSGFNVTPMGVNIVGLQRAGLEETDIVDLKRAYRLLYRSGLKLGVALDRITAECGSKYAQDLIEFVRRSDRGICRP
jgi:UDP-N-acetylglucosamine acyltransferase